MQRWLQLLRLLRLTLLTCTDGNGRAVSVRGVICVPLHTPFPFASPLALAARQWWCSHWRSRGAIGSPGPPCGRAVREVVRQR